MRTFLIVGALMLLGGCGTFRAKNDASEGAYYFAQNDFKNSTRHFHKAVRADPKNTEYLTLLGWSCFKLANYPKAIATFGKLGKMDPKCVDAYTGTGWCYFKQDDYDRAIRWFEKAAKVDPSASDPYSGLGWCHLKKGEADKAEKYFFAVLRRGLKYGSGGSAKTDPEAHRGLGYLNFGKRDYPTALRHFKTATILMPDWNDARVKWGDCLAAMEKYMDSLEVYRRSLDYAKSAELYDKLGWTYFRLKDRPSLFGLIEYGGYEGAAREMFKKALAIDPTYASSLSGLAKLSPDKAGKPSP